MSRSLTREQLTAWLDAAHQAADAAESIINHYYHGQFDVMSKSDSTPVTQADIEAEQAIREVLLGAFPDHGWFGEESGTVSSDSGITWLVDPIDGTKSFVRGYPFFSTQIALMVDDELVLGVSNAPAMKERSEGVMSEPLRFARINGREMACSDISALNEATLSSGNIASLAESEHWAAFGSLISAANRTRGYGDFYHYHMLADGKLEIIIESDVNILDIAALTVIVRAAGGTVTTLSGDSIDLNTTSILATNANLHKSVLEVINGT